MKNKVGIGGVALGGFALFSEGSIAIITGVVSLVVMVIWGITMLLSYVNNRKSQKQKDELDKREQESEIAKHEAEKKLFDAKLKEMNDEQR